MDQVATSTLAGAGKGASYGASVGSIIPGVGTLVGGGIGAIGGAAYGYVQGEKIVENERLEDIRVDKENKEGKLLAQANAVKSHDESYNNSNFSSISGTSTLPMSDPTQLRSGTEPIQPTQRDQQLQSLGFG